MTPVGRSHRSWPEPEAHDLEVERRPAAPLGRSQTMNAVQDVRISTMPSSARVTPVELVADDGGGTECVNLHEPVDQVFLPSSGFLGDLSVDSRHVDQVEVDRLDDAALEVLGAAPQSALSSTSTSSDHPSAQRYGRSTTAGLSPMPRRPASVNRQTRSSTTSPRTTMLHGVASRVLRLSSMRLPAAVARPAR